LQSVPARFGNRGGASHRADLPRADGGGLRAAGARCWPSVLYWVGWLAVVALLVYEHSLVSPGDLSRLDVAFFNVNGYIAVIVLASVVGGLWW